MRMSVDISGPSREHRMAAAAAAAIQLSEHGAKFGRFKLHGAGVRDTKAQARCFEFGRPGPRTVFAATVRIIGWPRQPAKGPGTSSYYSE